MLVSLAGLQRMRPGCPLRQRLALSPLPTPLAKLVQDLHSGTQVLAAGRMCGDLALGTALAGEIVT